MRAEATLAPASGGSGRLAAESRTSGGPVQRCEKAQGKVKCGMEKERGENRVWKYARMEMVSDGDIQNPYVLCENISTR